MPDWSTAPPYQEHQQRWLCAVSGWKAQALPSRGCLCLEKAQPSIIPLFLSTTPLFFPPHHFPSLSPWEFVPVVLRKAGSWQQQLRLCHSIWVPASPVTTLTPAGISDMGNVRSICWGASSAGFCRGSSHRLTALWIFQSCFIREPDSSGD